MERREPKPLDIRTKFEEIKDIEIRIFCETLYLLGASEVQLAGIACKNEKEYGPKGNDLIVTQYYPQGIGRLIAERIYRRELTPEDAFSPVDVALFNLTRPKTEDHFYVALPFDESFEPLTKQIVSYFKEAKTNKVFNFNRKRALDYITNRKFFDEYSYPGLNPSPIGLDRSKVYGLDGLRYTRRQELRNDFGFSDYEISVFEGTANINLVKPYELYLPKLFEKRIKKGNNQD
jgi:hypothetical protein